MKINVAFTRMTTNHYEVVRDYFTIMTRPADNVNINRLTSSNSFNIPINGNNEKRALALNRASFSIGDGILT